MKAKNNYFFGNGVRNFVVGGIITKKMKKSLETNLNMAVHYNEKKRKIFYGVFRGIIVSEQIQWEKTDDEGKQGEELSYG